MFEQTSAFLGLILMVLIFIGLGYVDIQSRKFFKKYAQEKKMPVFYKRIKWLKECVNQEENLEVKSKCERILFHYKVSWILCVILMLVYLVGNILK